MADDLEHVEETEMLVQTINRLEQVPRLAIESGHHGADVGACKLLGEIALAPHRIRTSANRRMFWQERCSWVSTADNGIREAKLAVHLCLHLNSTVLKLGDELGA